MFAALVSIACLISPCAAQAGTPHRVGLIRIEGNTDTLDRHIHDLVRMRPGAQFNPREMREAAERLRQSGYFVVNPWRNIGPVVEVIPNELDQVFLDIRILVQEKPLNWLRMGMREVVYSAAMGDLERTSAELQWLYERGYQHFTKQ
jgi:hypothetical protein